MKMTIRFVLSIYLVVVSANVLPALACTDFELKTTDGDIINGRSMEWGADMHAKLLVKPRGEQRQSTAPKGAKGTSWQSKYGYVGVNAYNLDACVDGMNEAGLSFGLLWLPHYTRYAEVPPGEAKSALSLIDLGAWLLGNYATVGEAKEAIAKVYVWSESIEGFPGIPTAHVALHDATGKSLVIEFVNGQQKIYDNPVKVLTNSPPFDWQLINLTNYLSLSPYNAEAVKTGGAVLAPAGEGSGMFGVPGDWTPPSRFVRTAALLGFAHPAESSTAGVNLAQHILNAVDIPKGDIREKVNGKDYCDYTQWVVIKDLTKRVLFFRSYDNLNLRCLDLKKLDFKAGAKSCTIEIEGGEPAAELTVPKG